MKNNRHLKFLITCACLPFVAAWFTGCASSKRNNVGAPDGPPKTSIISVAQATNMGTARCQHSATLLSDGRVLVVGGREWGTYGQPLDSVEIYDPKTGTFSPSGPLNSPRADHQATLLPSGKVLITGGIASNNIRAYWFEYWDPATNRMLGHGGAGSNRGGATVFLRGDGKLQIIGGFSDYTMDALDSYQTLIFDMETGATEPDFLITEPRINALVIPVDGERFLLVGGENGLGGWHQLDLCELYTVKPLPGQSNLLAKVPLGFPIVALDWVRLDADTFALCGGQNQRRGDSRLAQIIKIQGNNLSLTSLTLPRDLSKHQTARLPDGRVLMIGGESFTGYAPTSERDTLQTLDSTKGTVTELNAKLSQRRAQSRAVTLLDGNILVTGGYCYDVYASNSYLATNSCDLLKVVY